ncbi:uncharacterized protein CEXT_57181 [Caerostris extrusa]|uniref:Gustatory receptor n=1 Tax=Caerostris extrusa TaxID=172846 RepID=A0AAV4WPD8_CAEEX|nr:uncharacterized protein CEXT_57181 [Caerostris extrusa]
MYLKGHWKLDVLVHSLYYTTIAATSLLAVIISADQAQSNIKFAKQILREFDEQVPIQRSVIELREDIWCWQDSTHTHLTAWGMFKIQRDQLMSISVLVISYGVLIVQYTA